MPAYSNDWTFIQLGGAKKELRLSGWNAPHGRARVKPILTPALKLRSVKYFYDGNDEPTVHIFGTSQEPFALEGRFMDKDGGQGFAVKMHQYVQDFVADKQVVKVLWRNLVAYTGVIEQYTPSIEAPEAIAWKIEFSVISNMFSAVSGKSQPEKVSPKEQADQLQKLIDEAWKQAPMIPPTMKVSIFDALSNMISGINKAISSVNRAIDKINSYEQALVGDLRRLRASLGQLKTAVINAKQGFEDLKADVALQAGYAKDDASFWQNQTQTVASNTAILKLIAEMDRAAMRAEKGIVKTLYTAKLGDSWESIATSMMGSSSKASVLQQANKADSVPIPGHLYVIPK